MATRAYIQATTYEKAREIGAEMAADPALRPHLLRVAQYAGYFQFRLAHRAHLEASQRFERYYQDQIHALADREAKSRRVRRGDMESWDSWYQSFVHPIKTVVWQSWERRLKLEAKYLDALLSSGGGGASIRRMLTSRDEPDPDELPRVVPDRFGLGQMPQWFASAFASSFRLLKGV